MTSRSIDVEAFRAQLPVTRTCTYLNSGWSGPSPTTVVDRVVEWLRWEAENGPTTPGVIEKTFARYDEVRVSVAETIGGGADEIAVLENTTEGINVVINGLDWAEGDEVVTVNFEHPSIFIPLYHLRDRKGVKLTIVRLQFDDSADQIVERVVAAFTGRTKLLAISHVSFSAGMRLPLAALTEAAHAHGVEVLVDGAQSAGHIAIDVKALNTDYYALTGHKWLMGPDGAGALHIRKDRIPSLVPSKIFARAAVEFDNEGHWVPNLETPSKFELTTTSPALLSGTLEALAIYRSHGATAIENRTRGLGLALRERLASLPNVTVWSPKAEDLATGLVVFSVEGKTPEDLTNHLWTEHKIVCRTLHWPEAIRATCHYFNTEAEIGKLADVIAAL